MRDKILVDEDILGCAVRYALGRSTYMVGLVCDQVLTLMRDKKLSIKLTHNILRDIKEADSLGNHSIDINAWNNLKESLANYLVSLGDTSLEDETLKTIDNLKSLESLNSIPYVSVGKYEYNSNTTLESEVPCNRCGKLCSVYKTDPTKSSDTVLSYISCKDCDATFLVGVNSKRL
jgi:hypothetical protein